MHKIAAALIATAFAVGAQAQTPAATPAPDAPTAPAVKKHKTTHAHKAHKSHKVKKDASST